MPGSAGSKYGIIDDEVPVKKNRIPTKTNDPHENINKLRDIRVLIRERAHAKPVVRDESK